MSLYPIVVWGLSRVFGRMPACDSLPDADLPSVSVLIAAHNEEKVIADRIANALALDYPRRSPRDRDRVGRQQR